MFTYHTYGLAVGSLLGMFFLQNSDYWTSHPLQYGKNKRLLEGLPLAIKPSTIHMPLSLKILGQN